MLNYMLLDKTAIKGIGPGEGIAWYGIIFSIALIVALTFAIYNAHRIKLTGDDILTLFLCTVPLAVIFARILYVATHSRDYSNFVDVFKIWEGGVTIYGGVLGGILGVIIFAARKKISFFKLTDFAVSPLLVGQMIGRWGNYVNQEAFGIPIKNEKLHFFPIGIKITNPSGLTPEIAAKYADKNGNFIEGYYAATFFYEICFNAIGLALIYTLWRKYRKYKGVWTTLYLFWFMLGRGLIDFLRLDGTLKLQEAMKYAGAPAFALLILFMLFLVYAQKSREIIRKVEGAIKRNTLKTVVISMAEVRLYTVAVKMLDTKEEKNLIWKFYKNIDKKYFINLKESDFILKTKEEKLKGELAFNLD